MLECYSCLAKNGNEHPEALFAKSKYYLLVEEKDNQHLMIPQKKKKKKIPLSAKISNEIALILSKHLSNKKATHFLLLYQ